METDIDNTIVNCLKHLHLKQTILYPTDTVWGIGCDATNKEAVKKIYHLKKREQSKALIVLVSSVNMLKKHVAVPKKALQIIQTATKPTTIIYNNPKGLAQNLIHKKDNTVAIRIVQDDFCRKLIKKLRKPIVATSANISGNPTPKSFSEIALSILNGVDYVVDLCTEKTTTKSSTILKIEPDDTIVVIRT